ncbi:MAG: type IV pilin protein [Burkholderiales bacterium]
MLSLSTPTARGFTLIELLCAMAVSAILAALSLPSFHSVILKTRRVDGLATIMQLQLMQERHRADHMTYGTLAALQHPAITSSGHYSVSLHSVNASGYQVLLQAQGTQQADARCRYLQLQVQGLNQVKSSGPTAALNNTALENRACWSL